jgi:hypothetical protein
MDKRKTLFGGIVAAIIGVAAAWAFGLFGGTDPAIAKLQKIGNQMEADNLPEAQRDQLRDQFRQQMRSMTDEQRSAFFDANRNQWQARAQQRMDEFFAMPRADQQKRLDDIINRMSQPRGNRNRGGQNGGDGRGWGGDRGGRSSMTEAQREERSKRRLDGSTPKMRAQYAEFRRMLNQRAEQRGVPLNNNGWGRGFGS